MSKKLLIFKAGKYPQGDYTKERLERLVEFHNSGQGVEIPFVIAHRDRWSQVRDEDEFSYGWIKKLELDGGRLFATEYEFSDDAKKLIAEKKLRYMSAEIIPFDQRTEGKDPPMLVRVALLGRNTPAVSTAKLPDTFSQIIAGGSKDSVENKDEGQIDVFTQRIDFKDFENNKKEEDLFMEKEIETLKGQLSEANQKIATFEQKEKEREQNELKSDAQKFYSELRDAGKITPAQFEDFVSLDLELSPEAREIQRKAVSLFESKVGNLSGKSEAKGNKSSKQDLNQAITAYMQEHSVCYEEAANVLFATKPELFSEV